MTGQRTSRRRRLPAISASLIALVLISSWVAGARTTSADASVQFSLSPSSASVAAGASATLSLQAAIPAAVKLGSYSVDVTYNVTPFTATSCDGGNFGICNAAIPNRPGVVRFAGVSLSGVTGTQTLGTFVLKATGTAALGTSSALTLTVSSVTDPLASDLPYGKADGTITVAAGTTTATTLTSSINPTVAGQKTSFTATVAGLPAGACSPTGTVTFKNGTTVLGTSPLSNGNASLATGALSVGPNTITAVYGGDAACPASTSNTLTQTVNRAASITTAGASAAVVQAGHTVTLNAIVAATAPGAATPTGSVVFAEGATALGSATLSSGAAAVNVTALLPGAHTITAVYAGDGSIAGSTSATFSVTIVTADANGNGTTDSGDALCVLRQAAGLGVASTCPSPLPNGDVNGDGQVDATDALCILRYVIALPATPACPLQ